jgi:hypothetical protein
MKYLHCQIRVTDFEQWISLMEAEAPAQQEAGLRLIHLWRSIEAPGHAFLPGQAFFVMEVQDIEKALTNYLTPLFFKWAKKGVLHYEWHFTEEIALPVTS